MSQYIIVNRIKVQNANAIAGFTWGFPSITHFLGFVHNLSRKLAVSEKYSDITLLGCMVIAHEHQIHTYRPVDRKESPTGSGKFRDIIDDHHFVQSKNPAYLEADMKKVVKGGAPSVIEEGKMNMTVSLLINYEGTVGNREDGFKKWFETNCYRQRLAGGMILDISNLSLQIFEKENDVRVTMRRLLPGFVLMDRAKYLKEHYEILQQKSPNAELLDAWLDFSALKQKARPKSHLITKHLQGLNNDNPENDDLVQMFMDWQNHLDNPYEEGEWPKSVQSYFDAMQEDEQNRKLLAQWKNYREPDEKTEADWEFIPKPRPGYLVPIMTGYKAISQVYRNKDVANTRDSETDVCFVESVHSVGEWLSAHRIKTIEQLKESVWNYVYEENWYLCKQGIRRDDNEIEDRLDEDDDIYN